MASSTREDDQTSLSKNHGTLREPRVWHSHPPRTLRWKRWRPQLVMRERYRRPVTWALRGLTAVGLGMSLVFMPGYWGLGVALLLAAVEQLLEHAVFLYSSIHIQPMPSFKYDPAKWESIAHVRLERDGAVHAHVLGLVFADLDYASNFFGLLTAWNLGDSDDRDNNIQVSFIRDQGSYFIWLYPGHERAPVRRSMEDLRRRAHHKREDAEPFLITISPYFCKSFVSRGALTSFLASVKPGDRFQLAAMKSTGEGEVETIIEIEPIWKYSYKSCAKHELGIGDYEYVIWKRQGHI